MVTAGQQVSRRALLRELGARSASSLASLGPARVVRLSGAAGGALLLAGCGHSSQRLAKVPSAVQPADVVLLNQLLAAEHLVVAAYVAATPLLSGHNRRAAVHFLDQELDHVTALEKLVRSAHGHPRGGKSSYDLGHPHGASQLLELLRRVEDRAIATYLDALPGLASVEARQTAASILAVEAQHASVIRRNLGLTPVPSPLVTGVE